MLLAVVIAGFAAFAIESSAGAALLDQQFPAGARHTFAGVGAATVLFASIVFWICHRQSGRAPELWLAAAFCVLAVSLVVDALVGNAGTPVSDWSRVVDPRTGMFLCVLIFVMAALLGPEVDTRFTSKQAMACVALVPLMSSAVVVCVTGFGNGVLHAAATESPRSVAAVTVGLWVAAALVLMQAHQRHVRRLSSWDAAMFGCLSVASWTYVDADTPGMSGLTVFALSSAGAVALFGGLRELHRRAAIQNRAAVAHRLDAAARDDALRDERERRAATAHDLRSGLLAIEAALERLAVIGGAADASSMARAASAETARLRRQVSVTGERGSPRVIDVHETIGPVLLLERARAVDLHVDIHVDARACITPDALITALRVLLDNARRHAPLARVEVTARSVDDRTVVVVRDHGCVVQPGSAYPQPLPGDDRRDSEPHGIGLLSARRLVEQHGGTLRVDDTDRRGLAFVIDLPATEPPSSARTSNVQAIVTGATTMMRRTTDARARHRDVAIGQGAA